MARSRPATDQQDDDRGVETRNPAHQPSGRLPGPLHQCYCPGHSPRCQSRRVCATTCVTVRSFDGADRPVDANTAACAGSAGGTGSVRPFSVARPWQRVLFPAPANGKLHRFPERKWLPSPNRRPARTAPRCAPRCRGQVVHTNCRQCAAISTFTASPSSGSRLSGAANGRHELRTESIRSGRFHQ